MSGDRVSTWAELGTRGVGDRLAAPATIQHFRRNNRTLTTPWCSSNDEPATGEGRQDAWRRRQPDGGGGGMHPCRMRGGGGYSTALGACGLKWGPAWVTAVRCGGQKTGGRGRREGQWLRRARLFVVITMHAHLFSMGDIHHI